MASASHAVVGYAFGVRVLVTGGTGFVGCHTVAALQEAGHQPRLLVRSLERVAPALAPLGVALADDDVVVGDATDAASIEHALEGCDAAIHAASVVSLHVRDAGHVLDVNTRAAELVLGGAHRAGLDPIVHVSSLSALVPQPASDATITADTPVPDPESQGPYGRSKAAAEHVARRLQAEGAPVVTVYPSMVMGPCDPHRGEGTSAWRSLLRGLMPVMPKGGFHIVDVRDLGALLAAMVQPGRGPRRYLTTGHHVAAATAVADMSRLTGRWLPVVEIPTALVHLGGRLADFVQQVLPVRLPLGYEAVTTLTTDPDCDDGDTWTDLGVSPRPLDDTTTDLIRWLVAEDLLSPAQAGKALI
jgi:nucleoside-diphosphate-sugar epimerase